jgi:hypothetical protein
MLHDDHKHTAAKVIIGLGAVALQDGDRGREVEIDIASVELPERRRAAFGYLTPLLRNIRE